MNSPNQLSFLPDDYLERKAQRRTNVICAALFVIVMCAIGSAFMFSERAMRQIEKAHAVIGSQYADAARKIEQVQKMQDQQRKMARQAELTASLLEKVPRSYLLAELTNSLPTGVSLIDMTLDSRRKIADASPSGAAAKTAFEQKKAALEAKRTASAAAAGLPTAEPRVYEVTVRVTGIAPSDVQVAQFIGKLNGCKLLKDVNLIVSDEYKQQDEKLRRFQIEMMLRPDADVPSATAGAMRTAAVDAK